MQTSQTKQTKMQAGNAHFSVVSATARALFGSGDMKDDLTKCYAAPKSPSGTTPESTENDVMNPADPSADEGAIDISAGIPEAGPQDTPPSKP